MPDYDDPWPVRAYYRKHLDKCQHVRAHVRKTRRGHKRKGDKLISK